MKIETVLENLEELFTKWKIFTSDWVFTAQYAFGLQGYSVEVRKGHLNIQVNKTKIPWEVGEALETHPPLNTKYSKQYFQFERKTDFEFDITPVPLKDFKRKAKHTISHSLPNGKKIRVQTPRGGLEELDIIFSMCNDKGWGEEKGYRVMPAVEDQWRAILKKKEFKLAKAYEKLIKKYEHFTKPVKPKLPGKSKKVSEFKGITASKGVVKGKVNVVLNPEATKKFEKGEILVTTMTSPKFIIFLKKAAAIVTDGGGTLCHAAIVAREMKIPCVVGTKIATKVLKDGDWVKVNANKGIITRLK